MRLTALLSEKKSVILGRWLNLIFESYAPETAIFLRKDHDRFDNPVGYRLSQGLAGVYEALIHEMDKDKLLNHLDEIIRIRVLQNFAPSQALAFIFLLKNLVREELAEDIQKGNLAGEVMELEACIDGLALLAFDVYTKRRDKLQEIRVNEMKQSISGLLRKAGIGGDSL
jgi:hypothetical protein